MREMDQNGLLLCEIQAKAFECSADEMKCSSKIFIRRFMHSDIAIFMDHNSFLNTNLYYRDLLERVDEQYGESDYGQVKFNKEELYWIGYIYRYYAYTYELSSRRAYKIIKPDELRKVFLGYHTLSPAQAIERILESKGLNKETELERQYRIFCKYRRKSKED